MKFFIQCTKCHYVVFEDVPSTDTLIEPDMIHATCSNCHNIVISFEP